MRTRTKIATFAFATGLFVTGVVAQHEDHPNGQPDTPKTNKMMSGNMMSHMQQMKMGQDETGKLLDQLLTNFAAIETEKDPVALKQRLAEHGALLKQLQTRTQTQSHMMDMMHHMMGGSMMGGSMMGGTATEGEPKK